MFRKLCVALFAALALNAFAAVDVNGASQADLESVKGIGPGLSAKIVKARASGGFKDWADLVERVGGIGRANAMRLSQAGLTVAGAACDPATLPAAAAKAAAKAPRSEATGQRSTRRMHRDADRS
ncbi:MAG: hypothetical protein AMXMBFR66_23590 [Pseudomonadota bacterium]|nr:helix-hairpin-helix domain-containing protein [Rubrivivax sp.]NLZ41656.1 hypothetical protein [Comamonadaceae bacterium]